MWWCKCFLFLTILVSCFHKPKIGGPCTYKTSSEAIIVHTILQNDNFSDIKFKRVKIEDSTSAYILYSQFTNRLVDSLQISKIKIGDTCFLLIDEISSGSCTPRIYSFKFPN